MAQSQNGLTFITSHGIKSFLADSGATRIDIKPAKEEGKKPYFVTDAGHIGTVTDNADIQDEAKLRISLVRGDNGKEFYMMHKAPSNDDAIATFTA